MTKFVSCFYRENEDELRLPTVVVFTSNTMSKSFHDMQFGKCMQEYTDLLDVGIKLLSDLGIV